MAVLFLFVVVGVAIAAMSYQPYCGLCGKQPCIAVRCPKCKKKQRCGQWGETCECHIKRGPDNSGLGGTLDGGAGTIGNDDC